MVTNISSMSALSALRSLNTEISDTSNRIATGKRINSAADSPAFWGTIADTKADIGVLRQTESTLKFGAGLMSTTSAALGTIRESLLDMREIAIAATPNGADRVALQQGLAAAQESIRSAFEGATFNGVNLLTEPDATGTHSVVTGRNSGGVTTIDIDVTRVNVGAATDGALNADFTYDGGNSTIMTVAINAVTDADASARMGEILTGIDAALGAVETAELTIGTAESAVNRSLEFNTDLMNAKQSALDAFVKADIESEAARLTSLQTKQQLAIQALAISNSSVSSVLALFR